MVYGSAVNDVIYAPDGASVLYGGGGGNNWALELPYNDVFVIGRSATQVEIIEREGDASSASNLLKFISGIRSDQAIVSSNAHGDVVITIANGPVVVIDAMLLKPINGVQQVEFSDGVTWTREQVISHLSVGAGSDYIVGTSAGEVLDGGGATTISWAEAGPTPICSMRAMVCSPSIRPRALQASSAVCVSELASMRGTLRSNLMPRGI